MEEVLTAESTAVDYETAVSEFLSRYGAELHAAAVASALASWNFKQRSTKRNQGKLISAQKKQRQVSQNVVAYARVSQLIAHPRFQSLKLELRRALEQASAHYEKEMPLNDDDPQFQPLRESLQQRQTELERIRTAKAGEALHILGTFVPQGQTKAFAELVRDLVVDRNRSAHMRGFNNFYAMRMNELSMDFDQMREMIRALKNALNTLTPQVIALRQRQTEDFFLDTLAARVLDPGQLLRRTAKLMGVPVATIDTILEASDLYPRPNKNAHWSVEQIDAPFDVRASTNIARPPQKLTGHHLKSQLLHELFGHGVDCSSIRPDLQPLLRSQDSFSMEAIAKLSEQLVFEPGWLEATLGLSPTEVRSLLPQLRELQLNQTLRELRLNTAVVEFELTLYEDPLQDLDAAWAQAMAGFNGAELAAGSWAAIVPHYLGLPCYYHCYVLGLAWAAQVRQTLRSRFGSFTSPEVGPFMAKHRRNGLLYSADEQILRLSGKPFGLDDLLGELTGLIKSLQ